MLSEKAKKLNEKIDEIKNGLIKEMVSENLFEDMDTETLDLFTKMLSCINLLQEYFVSEAHVLEDIDYKLDRIADKQKV